MERSRPQDRGDHLGFNPPPESPSPVKLPLAPIDRRGIINATLSTRRGSDIFSPAQTLDHPRNHPPPPHHHVLKSPSPSPDPDPSTPVPNSRQPPPSPQAPPPPQSTPPPPPPPPPENSNNSISTASVRYRECLKNHAASMGGHVVDGCGEFMPNGEEGTVEALRCAACDCHRNFHRKEFDGGEAQPSNLYQINPNSSSRTPLLNSQTPLVAAAHQHKHAFSHPQSFAGAGPAMVSFGGNSGGGDESSSDQDLNMYQSSGGGHAASTSSRKRFRTKFSQEQKDRMQEVAEKLGWRIQKQDEQQVQQLCSETGVKRQVFKVWMHNNKQAMKKRQL